MDSLNSNMDLRNKIIELALKEVGVCEAPPNSNSVKYNDWFYNKPVSGANYPWCGVFVSWVFYMAGISLPRLDYLRGFAGCQYAVKNVNKWGKIVTVPLPGDVVFFDWNGDGNFDHTGIFVKDLGKGLFQSIEGNTSFTNNSNGGEVMLRSDRRYKFVVFVRPNTLA